MAMVKASRTHSAATAVLSKHEGDRFGFGLRGSEGGGPVSICISRNFWRREVAFSRQCGNSRLRITRCEAAGENFGVRVGRMAEGFRQKAGKAAHVVATKADEATYVVSRKANEAVRAISRNADAVLSEVKWKVYEFQEKNDVEGKVCIFKFCFFVFSSLNLRFYVQIPLPQIRGNSSLVVKMLSLSLSLSLSTIYCLTSRQNGILSSKELLHNMSIKRFRQRGYNLLC